MDGWMDGRKEEGREERERKETTWTSYTRKVGDKVSPWVSNYKPMRTSHQQGRGEGRGTGMVLVFVWKIAERKKNGTYETLENVKRQAVIFNWLRLSIFQPLLQRIAKYPKGIYCKRWQVNFRTEAETEKSFGQFSKRWVQKVHGGLQQTGPCEHSKLSSQDSLPGQSPIWEEKKKKKLLGMESKLSKDKKRKMNERKK